MSRITTVLFDLDGVLVDAREWHWEALNRALRLFGHEIAREEHLSTFDGLPTRKKLDYLIAYRDLPRGLAPLINDLKQIYTKQLIAQNCYPLFNVEYAVARLKREGYKIGVCTNSIRETCRLMLDYSGLTSYFDLVLTNQDCVRPKPSPDIYLEALKRLSSAPSETLVVEDNAHGIQAATEAGAHVLQVADPAAVSFTTIEDRLRSLAGHGA
jgi:HAD superfamily hydrolase (TIGR01509 family)